MHEGVRTIRGKSAIARAEQLAKLHGAEVVDSRDSVGKEYISASAGGEAAVQALKNDLEKEGWYAWPRDDIEDAGCMDFSLYPPPAHARTKFESELPPKYRYSGPTTNFPSGLLICAAFAYLTMRRLIGSHESAEILPTAFIFAVITAVYTAWDWITVAADDEALTVRHSLWAKPVSINYDKIKSAAPRSEFGGLYFHRYFGVTRKSGKPLRLYVPAKAKMSLYAFLSKHLGVTER